MSLTSSPGAQSVPLAAGVSYWGGEADSAKDRCGEGKSEDLAESGSWGFLSRLSLKMVSNFRVRREVRYSGGRVAGKWRIW